MKIQLGSIPTHRTGRRISRGMAVLLVLGLLAITLAASYATLRGQATARDLARNTRRSLDARAAAESGLAAALRKISDSSWAGVDVPLSGHVTDDAWYDVAFTTGDDALTSGNPDYNEWPYRLKIESTGYAADPADPAARSVHRVSAVVQLIRKQFTATPSIWNTVTSYTLYQWRNGNTLVQFPVRMAGPVSILGKLYLCIEYPQYLPANQRYLNDLNQMRVVGLLPDHRPFNGPLTIAYVRQDAATMTNLQSRLGLTTIDSTAATTAPLTHPGNVTGYRLYPGGKLFVPPIIQDTYGGTLSNVTLGADPQTNPLGVFRSRGALSVQNNVRVTGTIITDGSMPEIQIYGTNVILESTKLARLDGSTQDWQLPNAIVLDDLRVHSNSDVQMRGATIVWDEFELKRGTPASKFSLTGNLVTAGLVLRGRDTWTLTSAGWQTHYGNFMAQYNDLLNVNKVLWFPAWMQQQAGFTVEPALTIKPDSSGVRTRWQDWSQPIYQRDPADPGLRWDLVRYESGL